jgi:hypothetical protein
MKQKPATKGCRRLSHQGVCQVEQEMLHSAPPEAPSVQDMVIHGLVGGVGGMLVRNCRIIALPKNPIAAKLATA